MKGILANFFKYIPLITELVNRDLKTKYRRSILGYVWSLLNPLLMMIVVSSVFSYIFRNNIENYPIYLIIGQTTWSFFSEATNSSMQSIISSGSLLKKVYIPKYVFPLAKVLSTFVNMLFSMVAVFIVLIATGTPIRPTATLIPVGLFYLLLFSIGVGLILSVLAVFFRDLLHLYGVLLMAWMYLTPIFYSIEDLAPQMMGFIRLNPIYNYVTYMRDIILYGNIPTLADNLICFGIGVVSIAIGLCIFKKMQDGIVLYL